MAKEKISEVFQLKITLKNVRPPIWRRVEVPDCSLYELHNVIQICMGWGNDHLHSFEIGGNEYSEPDPNGLMECQDDSEINLSDVVAMGIKKFTYLYDFGDGWDHTILIEKVLPADSKVHYPRCTKGKRACPPEDCGGPWGYANLLETLKNPNDPEHDEMMEWVGGKLDPEEFDLENINKQLQA